MPVPTVSPNNWQRTKILCSFRMGTAVSVADELSFQDQLLTIVDTDTEYLKDARELEKENNDSSTTYNSHPNFEATLDEPHGVTQFISQTEPHRPTVDETTVTKLHEAVKREKPQVPAEKFGFDSNLTTVLDAAERYYEALQCEVKVANA